MSTNPLLASANNNSPFEGFTSAALLPPAAQDDIGLQGTDLSFPPTLDVDDLSDGLQDVDLQTHVSGSGVPVVAGSTIPPVPQPASTIMEPVLPYSSTVPPIRTIPPVSPPSTMTPVLPPSSTRIPPVPPSSTYTPVPPSSTYTPGPPPSTYTPVPPSSTYTPGPPPSTYTPVPPSSTYTPVPPPSTYTPVPPCSTYTPVPPPSTYTPVSPSSTYSPVPPRSTYTPVSPTSTYTPVSPTSTYTPIPPSSTYTPIPPSSTYTPGPSPVLPPTSTMTPPLLLPGPPSSTFTPVPSPSSTFTPPLLPPGPSPVLPPSSTMTPPVLPPPSTFTPPLLSPSTTFTPPVLPPSTFTPPVLPPSTFTPPVLPPSTFTPPVLPPSTFTPSVLPPSSTFTPPVLPHSTFTPGPPPSSTFTPPLVPPPSTFTPVRPPSSTIINQPVPSPTTMLPPPPATGPSLVPPSSVTTQQHLPPSFENMASQYHPVMPHWFYKASGKAYEWRPFSFQDSFNLEEALVDGKTEPVPVQGGRYDVYVPERNRVPVYWEEGEEQGKPEGGRDCTDGGVKKTEGGGGEKKTSGEDVRRCSWFRKGAMDVGPVPYSEEQAENLESAYKQCVLTGRWHSQVDQADGSRVVIHSPRSIKHYTTTEAEFPTGVSVNGSQTPLTVRRGTEDFEISDGESDQVDHLMLIVHGIGSVCDLRLRPVHQCVEDFRSLGQSLLSSHFRGAVDRGEAGRVEILPISWHKALHGEATGLDARLRPITLRSIPKLREFTNDSILDALLFTSPIYCQHIIDTVASEMERLYALYKRRNPSFNGKVSVAGHSLGSVILFDILSNQKEKKEEEEGVKDDQKESVSSGCSMSYVKGGDGIGQPCLNYPQLSFCPQAFFLMGSPLSMFVTVRGFESIGLDFQLPTCSRVLNIFHPFDPVAYRLEALVDPDLCEIRPVLIPHHKGRKRMHLELKDTLERVGSDIRSKIVDSIQGTWNKLYQIYSGEARVDQLAEHLLMPQENERESEREPGSGDRESVGGVEKFGHLNGGRRIDYVLQEKPYESFNEYIFALQAHLTYWESEDTVLLILKELYASQNILPDTQRASSLSPSPSTEFNTAPQDSFVTQGHAPPQSVTFGLSDPVASNMAEVEMFAPPPSIPLLPVSSPGDPSAFSSPSLSTSSSNSFTTPPNPAPSFSPSLSTPPIPPCFSPSLPPSFSSPPPPSLSPSLSPPSIPPPQASPSDSQRVIGGRPISLATQQPMGMDPTARPVNQTVVGPPPKMPTGNLNRKINLKR